MVCKRAALFRGRHFTDEIIVLCVRWYLRYSLSYRDLTEIMCERNLSIDPSTIWRWVQRYAPELNERIRRELKPTNGSWRTDETYVRVAGRWTYLYRAVDSTGATIDFLLSETRDLDGTRVDRPTNLHLKGRSWLRNAGSPYDSWPAWPGAPENKCPYFVET